MKRLKERITYMGRDLIEYIEEFQRKTSTTCKVCTLIAFIFFLIFTGIDIHEKQMMDKAEIEIHIIANKVFDPFVGEIEDMDAQTQSIMEPLKEMAIKMKKQWIKGALLIRFIVIGLLVWLIRKPIEGAKDIFVEIFIEKKEDSQMWIPCLVLIIIDIKGIFFSFL